MSFRLSLSALSVGVLSAFPVMALAAPVPIPVDGRVITLYDIVQLVTRVINYGIVLATLGVVAMIVYGGFKMATAGSTDADFTKGKAILYNAMWGALVVFAVGLIVNTIARFAVDPSRVIN